MRLWHRTAHGLRWLHTNDSSTFRPVFHRAAKTTFPAPNSLLRVPVAPAAEPPSAAVECPDPSPEPDLGNGRHRAARNAERLRNAIHRSVQGTV
jgi:hypothetical protein